MNSNKKTLTAILILLVMCTGISISYAFFKVVSSNNKANSTVTINGAALCMSLQLSSDNITISNEYAVPISDKKALSSDTYKTSVTITNNCSTSQSFNLLLVPNGSNTMPIKALKYALVEEGVTPTSGTLITNKYLLDSTIQKQLLAIKNETLKNGFSVGSGTVSSGTKTYSLYLWIDKDEGNLGNGSTMNKSLNAYLTLGSGSNIIDNNNYLYRTIENRYENSDGNIKLYNPALNGDSSYYPNDIYYFNGDVKDNNVLFGGFCWKILRTTETGGTKLIYNGLLKDDKEYTLLSDTEYGNLTNDENFPYLYNSENKTWTSTNYGTDNSIITFTAPTDGDYILNYDASIISSRHRTFYIYKDDTVIKSLRSSENGSIILDGLTTSNVIKVSYTLESSSSTNNYKVSFSFGKATKIVKSCNNTGVDSHPTFENTSFNLISGNNGNNSLAYAGYMYNKIYQYEKYTIMSGTISGFPYSMYITYGDSAIYDSSSKTYSISNPTTITYSELSNDINNKYVCDGENSSCTELRYATQLVENYDASLRSGFYYYKLSNGDLDINKNSSYIFGNSFIYSNGQYQLTDTIILNSNSYATDLSNLNTHKYTCLSSTNTCTSLYYAFMSYNGVMFYITLENGKSIDDALNEMLYNDNVNIKDSTLKKEIDNWYENHLISFNDKLEDTVFCNDRTIVDKAGWDPNGGNITQQYLYFNGYSNNNLSLECKNKNDRFTISKSIGNGNLKYPIGVITSSEMRLAGEFINTNVIYTTMSPGYLHEYIDIGGELPPEETFCPKGVCVIYRRGYGSKDAGSRPVISLKPSIKITGGDGSYVSPYIVE